MKLELPSESSRHGHLSSHNGITEDRPVLGLDFGTSNTVLASYVHNFNFKGPQTVTFAQTGSELYPSFALYNPSSGKYLTGNAAYRRRMMEPENVIRSVKRSLDKEFLIVSGRKVRPCDVVQTICHDALMQIHDINPQAVPLTVIATVPYHFQQNKNVIIGNAVKSACSCIFGKTPEVLVIPEPVAAALYWLYVRNGEFPQGEVRALIFDLGGGTLDLSHMRLSIHDNRIESEIVDTTGDSSIGGDDIDRLIYNYVVEECSIDIPSLPDKMQVLMRSNLLDAVVEAKHELTYRTESAVVCKFGDVDVDIVLQRKTVEELLNENKCDRPSFIDRIDATVAKIADRQSVRQSGFNYVILVGGPTKMPVIREYVKKRFPQAHILIHNDTHDYTCVALGASVYAAMQTADAESPFGTRMTLNQFRTRTPYNYYIQKYDGKLDLIVKSGQICPVSIKRIYKPTHLKNGNELVDLTSIRIFQGPNEGSAVYIGSIDIGGGTIYAHGREACDIPVQVELTVDSTILKAQVSVINGNPDISTFHKEVSIQI